MESSLQMDLLNKEELGQQTIRPTRWQKRFFNHLLDLTFCYACFSFCSFILVIVLGSVGIDIEDLNEVDPLLTWLFLLLFYVGYNLTFESIFGKTIGKMITNTKVVSATGTQPSFSQIVGRSCARLIPLDHFSFFADQPLGWHDTISGTLVVDDIALYRLEEVLLSDEVLE